MEEMKHKLLRKRVTVRRKGLQMRFADKTKGKEETGEKRGSVGGG